MTLRTIKRDGENGVGCCSQKCTVSSHKVVGLTMDKKPSDCSKKSDGLVLNIGVFFLSIIKPATAFLSALLL